MINPDAYAPGFQILIPFHIYEKNLHIFMLYHY